MSHCGVDYRKGRVFLTIPRWSKEEFQLMVFFSETPSLQPEVVGQEVRQALETVRAEAEKAWRTKELDAQSEKLHQVAGTKGWNDFVRGAAHVSVGSDGTTFAVTPSVNAGSRDGFLHMTEDQWLRLEAPSDTELGQAVLQGLARSGADL